MRGSQILQGEGRNFDADKMQVGVSRSGVTPELESRQKIEAAAKTRLYNDKMTRCVGRELLPAFSQMVMLQKHITGFCQPMLRMLGTDRKINIIEFGGVGQAIAPLQDCMCTHAAKFIMAGACAALGHALKLTITRFGQQQMHVAQRAFCKATLAVTQVKIPHANKGLAIAQPLYGIDIGKKVFPP